MKYGLLIVLIVSLVSIVCTRSANINAETTLIKTILDNYVKSIETENMELYSRSVIHNSEMTNFGAFGTPIKGWSALEKVIEGQNASLSDTKIVVSDLAIHVSSDGKVAWATCLWNLKATMDQTSIELPVRCTWVLEKQDGDWVVVHFHKSISAG